MTDTDANTDPDQPRRRWPGRLIGTFLAASFLMWTYALWGPESPPPGTMDDPAFGLAAEEICAPRLRAVNDLPPAQETTVADERADVIDQANSEIESQLDQLDLLVPATADDERMTGEWLADWRTYLADRQDYVTRLRDDDGARMLETEKGGDHISQALEFFADINAMPSCAPPGDVA